MAQYRDAERIALGVGVSIGGTLSIIGSSLIIYMAISHTREASQRPTYNRFLLAMSVYKISQAIWAAIGTMAVPKWAGGYGNIGTEGMCTAQGFFTTMSLSELIYNAGLSVYYVALIRYRMSHQLVAQRLEPFVHVLAFIEPMMFAISGLILTVFNPFFIPEIGCWASPLPIYCYFTHTPCKRGAYAIRWAYVFCSQQCLYVAIVIVMSGVLYFTVRTQYRAQHRYASQESLHMRERTREVANQALLFAAACLYTNMWTIIVVLNLAFDASPLWNKISVYNGVPAFHSQGFLNFLVYVRPRYVRLRRRQPELGRWGALVEVVCKDSPMMTRRSSLVETGTSSRYSSFLRQLSLFKSKDATASARAEGRTVDDKQADIGGADIATATAVGSTSMVVEMGVEDTEVGDESETKNPM